MYIDPNTLRVSNHRKAIENCEKPLEKPLGIIQREIIVDYDQARITTEQYEELTGLVSAKETEIAERLAAEQAAALEPEV